MRGHTLVTPNWKTEDSFSKHFLLTQQRTDTVTFSRCEVSVTGMLVKPKSVQPGQTSSNTSLSINAQSVRASIQRLF
jgi:hypothetical protein